MARHDQSSKLTRRELLERSAATGTALALGPILNLSACGDSSKPSEPAAGGGIASRDVLFGLYPSASHETGVEAVRAACEKLDWSWLHSGDAVLVKIASNSGLPHPASTSPDALRGLLAELFARGAGRVVVGEQSGVEYVRLTPDGRTFSSTRELLAGNGLLTAITESGAALVAFEEQGWDGYFEATPPAGSHWQAPLMLPNVLREVDHIVYMPRLSSHALAGYTHGHKIAVGWLREDSRNHLHHQFGSFYQKYVEVNYVPEIRDRLRLVLTFADKVLLDFGPDTGTIHPVDPRIVIASQSLVNHDIVSVAVQVFLDDSVPSGTGLTYSPATADVFNRTFVFNVVPGQTGMAWGPGTQDTYESLVAHTFEAGISQDQCLARAFEITGGTPSSVNVIVSAEMPDSALADHVRSHAQGIVQLT